MHFSAQLLFHWLDINTLHDTSDFSLKNLSAVFQLPCHDASFVCVFPHQQYPVSEPGFLHETDIETADIAVSEKLTYYIGIPAVVGMFIDIEIFCGHDMYTCRSRLTRFDFLYTFIKNCRSIYSPSNSSEVRSIFLVAKLITHQWLRPAAVNVPSASRR